MKAFVVLLISSIAGFSQISYAQDKKADKKPKAAKKAEPKASSQDWGRWSASGKKTLNEKEKKDAKAKK